MLLRVKVKNFLSFYKETTFDMFPNPRRETFPHHVYNDEEIPLLRFAALYGANGSGKTNLLEVINIIRKIVVDKDFLDEQGGALCIDTNKFRLAGEHNNEPSYFSIEFKYHKNKTYFIYELELDKNISLEKLSISGLGEKKDELIYSRKNNKITFGSKQNADLKKPIEVMLKKNPWSSLLALNEEFPIVSDERVKYAFLWFSSFLSFRAVDGRISNLMNYLHLNPKILEFANNLMSEIGIGINKVGIEETKMTKEDVAKLNLPAKVKNGDQFYQGSQAKISATFEMKNGEYISRKFKFEQRGINGYIGSLEFGSQSDGTAKILHLIPLLYDLIHKPVTFLVDELECSIHPNLIFNIMKYLSKIQTKGQLIFTTHATILLDQQELLRPDEVWFAEKEDGNTNLYSLNEFKEHNTINIEKGYLQGRYGAIPFIGYLDISDNDY